MENDFDVQKTLGEIVHILDTHFKNDKQRVNLWLTTPNSFFNNLTPFEMVNAGKADKLLSVLKTESNPF